MAFAPCPRSAQVLKYGAMSANIITEEPIDMVLHESYPNRWAAVQLTIILLPSEQAVVSGF